MKPTFKNKPGYIVVDASCVDCDNAANGHVVEIVIDQDAEGDRTWRRASEFTICREKLKGNPIKKENMITLPYLRTESRDFRLELARIQNGENELCGVCVSHFYADYLDEEA